MSLNTTAFLFNLKLHQTSKLVSVRDISKQIIHSKTEERVVLDNIFASVANRLCNVHGTTAGHRVKFIKAKPFMSHYKTHCRNVNGKKYGDDDDDDDGETKRNASRGRNRTWVPRVIK